MPTTHDWQRYRDLWIRVIERQTGANLDVWNERIHKRSFADTRGLRAWLSKQDLPVPRSRWWSWSCLVILTSGLRQLHQACEETPEKGLVA